jgi:aldehyde dehydrogenase (NAD+)
MEIKKVLKSLGIEGSNFGAAIGEEWIKTSGVKIASYSPVDGEKIGEVIAASPNDYHHCIEAG